MSELNPISLSGLAALNDPHLNTLSEALIVSDADTDLDSVRGRNGYRSLLPSSITSTGTVQHFGRFRPSSTSQRFVAVIGGNIYLIVEASSETTSDGTVTLLGTASFGATDNVCGAAEGTNYYLVNESNPALAFRITSDYTLHALLSLPQAAVPSFQLGTLQLLTLHGLSTTGSTLTGPAASGVTGWDNWSGTIGNVGIYTLGSTFDWSEITWLMVACSPETISGGHGTFKVEIGTAAGAYVPIATVSDPPNTNGSPWVLYGNLQGLDPSILGAVNKIRFTQLGPTTDPFSVYGVMAIPTAPEPGTVNYYVTYFNSVTGVESTLSTALPVIYNNSGVVFPTFLAGHWNFNSFQNIGTKSSNPDTQSTSDNFNKGIGLASPAASDFSPVYTFTGIIPTGAQYNNADTVRLYRSTAVGISLVGSSVYSTDGTAANAKRADGSAWTSGTGTNSDLPANVSYWQTSGTTWAITDNTGPTAAANLTYSAGGPFPPSTQLTAYAGRLCSIYQNRVSISSFTPPGTTTNPVPQWPPIALVEADGWSYDVSPAPTEIGLGIDGNGDALYIGTSEMVRSMSDVSPNSPPFVVLRRGVIGRQAYGFFEQQFFWCAWDGVYMSANQSSVVELTQPIRSYYLDTFQPDNTLVMAYKERKLYIWKGSQYIRYDFVKKRWSTGTIGDSAVEAISFNSPVNTTLVGSIADLYNAAYEFWPMTEAANATRVGIKGQKNLTAALMEDTAGVCSGLAAHFHSGVQSRLSVSASAGLQPIAPFEFSGWFNADIANVSSGFLLGCQATSFSQPFDYSLFIDSVSTPHTLTWQVRNAANTANGTVAVNFTSGVWYYFDVYYDGATIGISLTPSGALSRTAFTTTTWTQGVRASGGTFWIGTSPFAGSYSTSMAVSNVGVYTRVLSTLQRDYLVGLSTSGCPPAFPTAIVGTPKDQLWIVPTTRFVGRWQTECRRDMQIGTDTTTGTAIPDWVYRSGFAIAPEPNTVNGVMLDASGPVQVQIGKVANGIIPLSARNLPLTVPFNTIDENWYPGAPDLRGYKMSFRFQGGNDVVLRRAMYEAGLLPGAKGG